MSVPQEPAFSGSEGGEDRDRRRGSPRRPVLVGGCLAALAVGALLGTLAARESVGSRGGQVAVGFELENVRRGAPTVSLDDYRGQPVVINFFASWCVPCRREMADLEAVHARFRDRVVFVGVNHQDQRSAALDLRDADHGVISPEGRVVERRTGEMSERDLEHAIARLFDV